MNTCLFRVTAAFINEHLKPVTPPLPCLLVERGNNGMALECSLAARKPPSEPLEAPLPELHLRLLLRTPVPAHTSAHTSAPALAPAHTRISCAYTCTCTPAFTKHHHHHHHHYTLQATRAITPNEPWRPTGGVFAKGKGQVPSYLWTGDASTMPLPIPTPRGVPPASVFRASGGAAASTFVYGAGPRRRAAAAGPARARR